jgi:putative FmdB family regulatory protein
MPTYDYLCSACGHRFEEFQSMSAKPLRQCPECKKKTLDRLIGAGAGVIFKGSGFYQTDYRGGSYSSDAKKDESGGDAKKGDSTGGGCTPTCGTDAAPKECKMPKQKKA